jgi:uncharacterized protein YdeI (YjbR/CyaY-like superfamily)
VDFAIYIEERKKQNWNVRLYKTEAFTVTEFNEVFLGIQPCYVEELSRILDTISIIRD